MADYSQVEWELSQANNGSYNLSTNHDVEEVSGLSDDEIRWKVHSHPRVDGEKGASNDIIRVGINGQPEYGRCDMNNIAKSYKSWIDEKHKSPESFPAHFVYHRYSKNLYYYNNITPNINFGKLNKLKILNK